MRHALRHASGHIFAATALAVAWLAGSPILVGYAQNQEAPIAGSKLNLTMEQRHVIKELIKSHNVPNETASVKLDVGQAVPLSIHLKPMPTDVGQRVSPVKSHVFFMKNDNVVVVDPKDNTIVDVIE